MNEMKMNGWRLRQAHVLQAWAQETQKLSYSGRQLHGSVGKRSRQIWAQDPLGDSSPMYCVVCTSGCQHMHEPELPLTAPINISVTNPAPEATVA